MNFSISCLTPQLKLSVSQSFQRLRNFKLELFVIWEGIYTEIPCHPNIQLLVEHRMDHAHIIDQQRDSTLARIFKIRLDDPSFLTHVPHSANYPELRYKLAKRVR